MPDVQVATQRSIGAARSLRTFVVFLQVFLTYGSFRAVNIHRTTRIEDVLDRVISSWVRQGECVLLSVYGCTGCFRHPAARRMICVLLSFARTTSFLYVMGYFFLRIFVVVCSIVD